MKCAELNRNPLVLWANCFHPFVDADSIARILSPQPKDTPFVLRDFNSTIGQTIVQLHFSKYSCCLASLVEEVRLELTTIWLKARCSAN